LGWYWDGIGDWVCSQLVHSYVIYYHLWNRPVSGSGSIQSVGLSSEETSSNGKIEDEEKSLIKWLSDVIVGVCSSTSIEVSDEILSVVNLSIDQPLDLISFPDQFEIVEIFREVKVEGSWSRSSVNIVGPSRSVMNSSFYHSCRLSTSFHDVDLPRSCPSSVNRVLWHHPNGWPQVISSWEFSSCYESSVFPSSSVGSVNSSGGVSFVVVVLGFGSDVQESVLYVNIVLSVGVALEFIVSSSVAVDFVSPFRLIEGISIEIVLPDEIVLRISCTDKEECKAELNDSIHFV